MLAGQSTCGTPSARGPSCRTCGSPVIFLLPRCGPKPTSPPLLRVPPAPFPHHLHHPLPSTCMCVPPGAPDSGRAPTNPCSQTHFFPLACVDLPAVEVAPCIAPLNHHASKTPHLIAFVDELCKRRSPHSLAAQVSPHPVYYFPFIVLLKLLSCPVRTSA